MSIELNSEDILRQGIAAHEQGKLQDAERLYRLVLKSQPQHPDANHNLGVMAASLNKNDAALPHFRAWRIIFRLRLARRLLLESKSSYSGVSNVSKRNARRQKWS